MNGTIQKTACIGTGVIGASWAALFALKGLCVALFDEKEGAAARGAQLAVQNMDFLVEKGVIAPADREEALARITCARSLEEAVDGAEWIQESAFESYEVKRSILAQIDRAANPEAIYATSSSGLSIREIARGSRHPGRCIAAHPYNPVYLIPLVEIVGVEGESPAAADRAMAFMRELGKEPVRLKREAPGFLANRIQIAVQREICSLVYRGVADIEDIDKAVTFGPGLRWAVMGPTLITSLGSTDARTMFLTLGKTTNAWLKDMADFKDFPEDWGDVMQAGVEQAMAHRPPELGSDSAALRAYRDDMLLKILALHGKLDLGRADRREE